MRLQTVAYSLLWLWLAGVVYYFAERALNPNTLDSVGNTTSITLKRGLDGHYHTEALINGYKISALVDTGATGVAISQALANQLGLKSVVAIPTQTANGDAVSYGVRLQSVQIGGINAQDVVAYISPNLQGEVLLGMSFLGRMDVRLFKDEMTIKQY
jgi:aspartyl protease family protein